MQSPTFQQQTRFLTAVSASRLRGIKRERIRFLGVAVARGCDFAPSARLPQNKRSSLMHLDGEIFPMDSGYWTKFEVYRVNPEPHIPHGVRYSLTLHDRYNRRVLGFDNAHAVKPARKGYGARKITWDHKHKSDKTSPYEYETASQLLEDFWREVERIMGQERKVEK